MKNKLFYILLLLLFFAGSKRSMAQQSEADQLAKPYHPEADASADIQMLLKEAQKANKNLIIQAGGNWCIWCLRFNNFIHSNPKISVLVKEKLLYYHLNYSKENKNEATFARYAPEGSKLGYPFFIVLDKWGKVLQVRDSGTLESGKGYDEERVLAFFNKWAN